MIPTVLGAMAGVMFHIPVSTRHLGFVLFLAMACGFIYAIEKTKNSAAGVAVMLGFTFFMGIWLTPLLTRTLGFSNGGTLIMLAFGGTGAVLAVMATIATVSKRDFSMMGKWLFAGAIALILASVAKLFFRLPALSIVDFGAGHRYFLGLHPVRRAANRQRRRDQLHPRDPEPVPGRVHDLLAPPVAAGPGRLARLILP